ncbi:MAG: MATE family efflux transporter [Clostridia bacterium]|nr:MATE family efflux transporter [Clostridia bacterium]
MVEGPLLPGIFLYALPLIATGLLQLLYNAADMIVVARWAGGTALAAVGSNGPLINLIVNVFMGLSVGASVVVSRAFGAGNRKDVHESVHCAMAVSVVSGAVTMAVGLLIARQALVWMGTPADVIDQSTLYLRIYFLGMPAAMVYNFGAAILRAVGDTKRPLYILTLSGLINVILNLILVIGFHWDVAGVATATTVSQIFSAVMVVLCLLKSEDSYRYEIRKTRFYKDKFLQMLRHGIPAGIQGSIFSLSNIIIQSSVNSFGSAAVAGNAASGNLEGLVYVAMNAFHHTSLSFTSQNVGAKKPERLRRIFLLCLLLVTLVGLVLGWVIYLFGEPLLGLYTATSSADSSISTKDILHFGMLRMSIIATTYFLCGIMEVLVGAMRGMGAPWMPMLVSIGGVCGVRILWIFTVFELVDRSLTCLYLSYPISWIVTVAVHAICYYFTHKNLVRKMKDTVYT